VPKRFAAVINPRRMRPLTKTRLRFRTGEGGVGVGEGHAERATVG